MVAGLLLIFKLTFFIASSGNSTLNNRANIESKGFGADLVVLSYF